METDALIQRQMNIQAEAEAHSLPKASDDLALSRSQRLKKMLPMMRETDRQTDRQRKREREREKVFGVEVW